MSHFILESALVLVWLLISFVTLLVTRGQRALHDFIAGTEVRTWGKSALPGWKKAGLALCGCCLVAATVLGMFVEARTGPVEDPVEVEFSPQDIRDIYRDHVYEIWVEYQTKEGWFIKEWVDGYRTGSGLMFVNDERFGLIVTNWHVLAVTNGARNYRCLVRLHPDEEAVPAYFVGHATGRGLDLALLLLELEEGVWQPEAVPYLPTESIMQGEKCVVIGNALGEGISVTDGVVSMVHSTEQGDQIRLSAPVNPGNSGGPLFLNREGYWVGTVTWRKELTADGRPVQNVNTAIPAEYALHPDNWEISAEGRVGFVVRNLLRSAHDQSQAE